MRTPKIRLSTIALVLIAALAGVMLFRISERVQTAEDNLSRMQEAAAKESETIRVLRAEWDYLNRPDRLESLAHTHLGMGKPGVKQVMTDGGDLPPVAPPATTLPVSMEEPPKAKPSPARLEPRRDTEEFKALLEKSSSAPEARE